MKEIVSALKSFSYSYSNEMDFQFGIMMALRKAGIQHLREYDLAPYGTIDFMCDGVGIEAKIEGSRHEVMRQVARYAKHADVKSIIIASARKVIVSGFPKELNGKEIVALYLGSAF